MLVLRVPELKGIEPAEEEPVPAPPSKASASVAADAPEAMVPEVAPAPEAAVSRAAASDPAPAEQSADAEASEPIETEDTNAEASSPPAVLASATAAKEAAMSPPLAPEAPGTPAAACVPGAWADDSDASDDEEALRLQEQADEDAHCDFEKAKELKAQGNDFFKAGKLHDAREAYSEALYLTPSTEKKDKAVLFGNRAACLQKLSRWDDVVDDCRKAIELDPTYAKAYHRRSAAYEALSKWHDANEDLKKVIELDPAMRSKEYKHQAVLEGRAAEQFDKDKEEMMGKLKEMGNMVLGKFGMSTDNFACEKDPSTGSYSIKFQQ